ncbi:30S ribosomal protein S3 [Candidatus Woesearchaeota archaeon]|nr:30S ribosomal protein S3 [Candidatus Woesearchaeota archaeon]
MIERQFVSQKTKEYYIQKYIEGRLRGVGISQIRLKKIPLGEKIIISASRPSLIVGSKGANIRDLTRVLKTEFKLENPQIEIAEVRNIFLDANVVAQRIAGSLERFGSARFKSVGHKIMENVVNSGALGVEIIISGKIPSARAKNWRFYQGYLKKCGDIAISGVRKAQATALLKSGIVGIKVAIMPPDIILPDRVEIRESLSTEVGEVSASALSPEQEQSGEPTESSGSADSASKKKASVKKKTTTPRKRKTKETGSGEAGEKRPADQESEDKTSKTVSKKEEDPESAGQTPAPVEEKQAREKDAEQKSEQLSSAEGPEQ